MTKKFPIIAFRTDASLDIGTGHVMRCLTLADALRDKGAKCRFMCRCHPGNLIDLIRKRGYEVSSLPKGEGNARKLTHDDKEALAHAEWLGSDWEIDSLQTREALNGELLDWLVVDHYAIDSRWEGTLRNECRHLMVIDDLADRPHDCDLLLDQNLGRKQEDYQALTTSGCNILIGPQYALLRPDFPALRPYSLSRRKKPALRHLLVTMGGVDKHNFTGKVLDALARCQLPEDIKITVVMGPHAPWLDEVRQQAGKSPWRIEVMVNVEDMARLMAESDLAIGAAGSTSWERCTLGLPAVLLKTAQNQEEALQALSKTGAVIASKINEIKVELIKLFNSAELVARLSSMSFRSSNVTDGLGIMRVLSKMFGEVVYESLS